jgi:hypothetical protein
MSLFPVSKESLWGYIDSSGRIQIPLRYQYCDVFSEGLASVCFAHNGKTGFIDAAGVTVIEPSFEEAFSFVAGKAVFQDESKLYGIIDRAGHQTVPAKYSWIGAQSHGLFPAKRADGKAVFLTEDGSETGPQFDRLLDGFSEGLCAASSQGKWGYLGTDFRWAIEAKFDALNPFSEGLAGAKVGELWGVIAQCGDFIVEPQFGFVRAFSEGLLAVRDRNGWGFMDRTGEKRIPCRYAEARSFQCGLAAVKEEDSGPWGFIAHHGEYSIKPQFEEAYDMVGGVAKFEHGGGCCRGLIRCDGVVIWTGE